MPYEILPYAILIGAVTGILILIGRRIPEAADLANREVTVEVNRSKRLSARLSLASTTKVMAVIKFWANRLWHFVLEAKDIKKPGIVGYKIKKILPKKRTEKVVAVAEVSVVEETHDERYYLEQIRQYPKNLELYNLLGKLYLDGRRYPDARDMFTYLVKRDPGNSLYYARLGYACFKLALYHEAVDAYEKALALDSAQPNRYYNLGLALDALGKNQEAKHAVKKALELEPENTKYLELMEVLKAKENS